MKIRRLKYPKNPRRDLVVLKRFYLGQFSIDAPMYCVMSKDAVEFKVKDSFQGAGIEYLRNEVGTGEEAYPVEQRIVRLVGFKLQDLQTKLEKPMVWKIDMFSSLRYKLARTRWDILEAQASRLDTLMPISAFPEGLTELPTYSIGEPSAAAVLIKNGKIIDFHYSVGSLAPQHFWVGGNGKTILYTSNKSQVRELETVGRSSSPILVGTE